MPDKVLTQEEVNRNLRIVGCIPSWLRYKHITQEQIANSLEVSKGAVSKWLQGKQTMSSQNLAKIAEILEIEVVDLLFPPGQGVPGPARKQAAELLLSLTTEDIARWLAFGEGLLSTKHGEV